MTETLKPHPARNNKAPIVLVAMAAAVFIACFFVFAAVYFANPHNGGPAEALAIVFGLMAPAVFIISMVARYLARRIVRENIADSITTPKSITNSEFAASTLALLAGVPAALGFVIVIFLFVVLSSNGL